MLALMSWLFPSSKQGSEFDRLSLFGKLDVILSPSLQHSEGAGEGTRVPSLRFGATTRGLVDWQVAPSEGCHN
jgi:hypothetical protein